MKSIRTDERYVKRVMFVHRADADSLLADMIYIASRYGYVTIADYYELCADYGYLCDELPSSCLDGKYGWTLDLLRVKTAVGLDLCSQRYYIDLPNAKQITMCDDERKLIAHYHVPAKNKPGEPVNIDIYTKEILNMEVVDKIVDRIMRENPDRPVFVHIQ